VHRTGVVHTDIKPENVLFKEQLHKRPVRCRCVCAGQDGRKEGRKREMETWRVRRERERETGRVRKERDRETGMVRREGDREGRVPRAWCVLVAWCLVVRDAV